MLHKIKNGLQLLEILRTILQYCHSLPIPSQNMGPKRRDLGNVSPNFEELVVSVQYYELCMLDSKS